MPEKARYWKNPQKHRDEVKNRRAYYTALGLSKINQLTPEAQKHQREYQKNYWYTHRKKNNEAVKRYHDKLRRLFGSRSPHAKWLHSVMRAEIEAKKRKKRAQNAKRKSSTPAILLRKLVENRRPRYLVSRW